MMTTIYWAGDSTVKQNTILTWPQTGIGQMFDRYIDRVNVRVDNHAENGRSTKSFLDEGRLALIYDRITKNDLLFIQFGHNDMNPKPERYTDPDGEFCDNLERFANAARNKQAVPVFITPVALRDFTDPQTAWNHSRWAAAMRRAAKKLNAALVDLTGMSEDLLLHTPWETVHEKWYMPDGVHLKPEGALVFAGLVAQGLYHLGGAYRKLLIPGFDEYLQERKNRR